MFHKINEGCVVSDWGFKIKLGRHHISYIEADDRAVTFEAEDTFNPFCIVVYFSKKEPVCHPACHLEKLSENELKIIKARIIDALQFLNIKYEIV